MRILIVFPSLNTRGGAEFFCISAIRALVEHGHKVTLLTLEETNTRKANRDYFLHLSNRISEIAVERRRTSSIYERLIDTKLIARKLARLRPEFELTINFKANDLPVVSDICYIHYPSGPAIYHNIPSSESVIDPKYKDKIFWRLYYQPFRILFHEMSKNIGRAKILLTNSQDNVALIKRFYSRTATILYPPIIFEANERYVRSKENIAVTISRITPNKQLYNIITSAQHMPEIDFYILGAIDFSVPESTNFFYRLRNDVQQLALKNLFLIPNATDRVKINLLSRAAVYIHPMNYEHFGISVLEAMRAGAVAIVRKPSGSWTDITDEGAYGYGFETQSELESILHNLISDKELVQRYSKLSVERAQQFNFESFKNKLLSLLEKSDYSESA